MVRLPGSARRRTTTTMKEETLKTEVYCTVFDCFSNNFACSNNTFFYKNIFAALGNSLKTKNSKFTDNSLLINLALLVITLLLHSCL